MNPSAPIPEATPPPPYRPNQKIRWDVIVPAMRARPGVWFILHWTDTRPAAATIARRVRKSLPVALRPYLPGTFQAAVRVNGAKPNPAPPLGTSRLPVAITPGAFIVYARYSEDPGSEADLVPSPLPDGLA